MRNLKSLFVLSAFCVSFSMAFIGRAEEPSVQGTSNTAGIMQNIFAPIAELLPLVFSQDQFESVDKQKQIISALEKLDQQAKTLESHAGGEKAGFKFLSQSLATDVRDALRWYKSGRYRESRFILRHVTENCISCHASLKSQKGDFPGSAEFIKQINLAELSPLEKARMELTVRRFSEAADSYEKIFADTQIKPGAWVTYDALTAYLKVTMGVKGDVSRPLITFQTILLKREDVPEYMQKQLQAWVDSLKKIKQQKLDQGKTLKAAVNLIRFGEKMQSYPADRSGLVFSILASFQLESLLSSGKLKSDNDIAEAYYNLGLVEMVVGRSFWVSQVDNYLEIAVRQAPKSDVAKKAYDLLEENIDYEFSGSAGTQIPQEKQALLTELKSLMRAKK